MAYMRKFMAFSCEADGYGYKGKRPGGRCILEMKESEGKLSCWAQDMKPETLYAAWLLFADGARCAGWPLGPLAVDARGKAEARYAIDPAALGRYALADCAAVVVMAARAAKPAGVLCGYSDAPFVWRHSFYDGSKTEPQPASPPDVAPPVLTEEERTALMPTKATPEAEEEMEEEAETIAPPPLVEEEALPMEEEAAAQPLPLPEEAAVPPPMEAEAIPPPPMEEEAAISDTWGRVQQLFTQGEAVKPFVHQKRPARWVKTTPAAIPLPESLAGLWQSPLVDGAYARFGHILLGLITDTKRPQYIIGVPDTFNPESRLAARRLGFMQFKHGARPPEGGGAGRSPGGELLAHASGEFGYWLLFINL